MLEKFHNNLTLYTWVFRCKMLLDRFPFFYTNALKFHRRNNREAYQDVVNNVTGIVIDGYPRSANSFALAAFKSIQEKNYNIATHVHTSSQIVMACRYKIPTLVLIRKPSDAVVSHKSLSLEISNGDKSLRKIPLSLYLKAYIQFYSLIYPYRNSFVLGKFEQVTTDFSSIIREINNKFSTNFTVFEHTSDNVRHIFDNSGFHLSPSQKRNSYKKEVYEELNCFPKLLTKAEQIYQRFIDKDSL